MQIDGLRFVPAVCLFPGFLKDRTPARMPPQIVNEVYFDQVGITRQVFIYLVIKQYLLVSILQFDFV